MANNRIARINADLTRTLASLIREIKDPRVNQGLISVTGTEVTSDLSYCKVWLSVLGEVNEREFRKGLKSSSGYLRRELAKKLNLRQTPELTFILDHSIEHGAHIADLLSKLDIPLEIPNEEITEAADEDNA